MSDNFLKHIDLDLSNKCNLRCRFCHLRYFDPEEAAEFDLKKIMLIEAAFHHIDSLTLFSKFEPLTCRDFLPIFKKLTEYNFETYFSTNGTLLSDKVIDILIGNLTYLTVSITGFTRETYKKNMGVDKLESVKQSIRSLNRLKQERHTPYPILRLSTVGLLDSVHELPLAVDLAAELQMDEGIQVTSFKAFSRELKDLMPMNDPDYFAEVTGAAQKYAAQKGIKFKLQSGSIIENQMETKALGHKKCDMPWYRLSIQPNGDVYPCPVAYKPIGNAFETNILDLWNSKKMEQFRQGVNSTGDMNCDCKKCTHCRHRSVLSLSTNDFSTQKRYIAGLRRK